MNKYDKMGREWTEEMLVDMTLVSGGAKMESRGRTARIGRDGMDLQVTNAALFGAIAPKVDTLDVLVEEACGCTKQLNDLRAVLAETVCHYEALSVLAGTALIQARLRLELLVGEVSAEAYEIGDYWRVVQESISISGTKEVIA